jgi:hypothetical protein
MKNNKEVYMQLRNLQQQGERVEVYYEFLLKLTNCLQVKNTMCSYQSRFATIPKISNSRYGKRYLYQT